MIEKFACTHRMPLSEFLDLQPPRHAQRNIAGICDATGRILGLMPHPERLFEMALGGTDGRRVFESMLAQVAA